MITIKLSFLLSFALNAENPEAKQEADAPNKKSDKASSKQSKKNSKELKIEVIPLPTPPENPKYLIPVGKPIEFCHVEYELLPGRFRYQIDIICWGPVAMVISSDGDSITTTYVDVDKNLAWVPVNLKHILHNLEESDLMKLYNHVVTYSIIPGKKKLGARAKTVNFKEFYIREEDEDSESKFVEAFVTNPNIEIEGEEAKKSIRTKVLENLMQDILWECADKPGWEDPYEVVTLIQFLSDPLHLAQVNKLIEGMKNGKSAECKDFVSVCPPPETNSDARQENKLNQKDEKQADKDKKGAAGGVPKISVPGEIFFTDPYLSVYDLKEPEETVPNVFVITTVKNLMSRFQKYTYNPLIIKIKSLSNLPMKILEQNRYKEIEICYNVPHIGQCTTIAKPLSKKVKFNESHAHFTHTVPPLELVEFMQTQRLYIEIRGKRDEYEEIVPANIFGTEKRDKKFGEREKTQECLRVKREEPPLVTLAVACLDISSLLKPTWDCKEKLPCHNPDNPLFQKTLKTNPNLHMLDKITTNEANFSTLFVKKSLSPLTEETLLWHGTTLKVEVHLTAPLKAPLQVYAIPNLYTRMVIVVNQKDIAMVLIRAILAYNQEIIGPEIVQISILKSPSKRESLSTKFPKQTIPEWLQEYIITGFFIDNVTSSLFYLEGLSSGFLSTIWSQIMHSHISTMKIFYNSDFYFEKRIYQDLTRFCGMLLLQLQCPLQKIIAQSAIYLEGNLPIPCFRALQKLNLMLNSTSLKEMIQKNLFPTPDEIISFAVEYTVPLIYNSSQKILAYENNVKELPSDRFILEQETDVRKSVSDDKTAKNDMFLNAEYV